MKIGITQRILVHNGQAYDATQHGWYSYLKDHTLVPVPNDLAQDFELLAVQLDALIITGGDDSLLRRNVELTLATLMMKQRKPIIGVCHGSFLLQSVLGGTLVEIEDHHNIEHEIMYFGDIVNVNSYHSLAIKQVHNNATILCVDPAGNCEAWIDGNLAGITWHPERMSTPWLPDEIQNLLFKETK